MKKMGKEGTSMKKGRGHDLQELVSVGRKMIDGRKKLLSGGKLRTRRKTLVGGGGREEPN